MSGSFTPAELFEKAEETLASARVMLDLGYAGGACNRAYYAMFDAARAALRTKGLGGRIKTHSGVINLFSLQFIKDGPLASDFGQLFKQAEKARYGADYLDEPVLIENAELAVANAEIFLATIAVLIANQPPTSPPPDS